MRGAKFLSFCLSRQVDGCGQVKTQYFRRQSGQLHDSGLHYVRIDRGSRSFASSWHDGSVLYRSSSLPLISSPVTHEVYTCMLLFSMVHMTH